ncbi:hemerythrin domain-containing protein [uncultured Thiodictyon sp.]|jgi:hemerythrin|uniref:bacteriohemerythrin n=1 Tax=uncultured Thiodictyon sp. TaxID=1846217 RepID=UPI0025F1817C|nr:hemerythrin domain-containing protein [uncultured Thiodictyon sp.]
MAAFLTWLTKWQTGVTWVDADHREITGMLNRIVDVNRRALTQDPATAGREVLAVLDALIECTRRHIGAEEAFLREVRLPGYDAHRCEHALQLAEFTDLRRALEQDGAPGLNPETLQAFKRWFFNHVIVEDRDYAEYRDDETVAVATAPSPERAD